jgi:hypothetical protein
MKKSTITTFVVTALVTAPAFFGSAQAQTVISPLASAQGAQAQTCASYAATLANLKKAGAAIAAAEANLKKLQAANAGAAAIQDAKNQLEAANNSYMTSQRTLITLQGQYDRFAQIIYANKGYNVCNLPGPSYM